MRSAVLNGAASAALPPTVPEQFEALKAQYDQIVASIDPAKGPPIEAIVMLTFVRVQMLDLKFDMLAMAMGKATDPARRIVVPGGG